MSIYPIVGTVEIPDSPAPWPDNGSGGQGIRGTWTPVIGGHDGESGQSYHYQTGHWVKNGPLVTVWSYTQFSNIGSIVGALMLKNLPFRALNAPGFFAGHCAYFSNLTPNAPFTTIMLYAGGAQVQAGLYGIEQGRYMNPRQMTANDLNNQTQLILSLSYPTD